MEKIIIRNARTHNLKNISIEIPRNKVVVFTGVSGSGKSSLVFDTLYTEAQRQLIDTFSSFARRRLPKLSRPPVDEIKNISTAIVIDQQRLGRNLRSTVGTVTELYTYLRLLYSRFGEPFIGASFKFSFNNPEGMCPACKGIGKKLTVDISMLIDKESSLKEGAVNHPDYKVEGWNWRELMACNLFDIEKKLKDYTTEELNTLLYADSIVIPKKHGISTYWKNYEGIVKKLERLYINKEEDELSKDRKTAYTKYFEYIECEECSGTRINREAAAVIFYDKKITELLNIELFDLLDFIKSIDIEQAKPITNKMEKILVNLINIGVGYLSLNRPVATLSGGESQRVKTASQLDCDLIDLMYILDEPTVGLHPRDTEHLIKMLYKLKERGNSVFVVEHDPDVIKAAEWIIDIGPRAGTNGGEVLFQGSYNELCLSSTLTSEYLKKDKLIATETKKWNEYFEINNASLNNLKNVNVKIPKGVLTCITGVAGSGKSSLISGIFMKQNPDAIIIDQSPAGKSSRSNPATFIGVFDYIRKDFAKVTSSDPSLFSFNSKGACEKCKGLGYITIEMNFMDDVQMLCDECNGQRYKEEVLKLKYNGKNIYDILTMTVAEAEEFFESKEIKRRLKVLNETGLDYLELGQPLSTLSGGEAQRLKMASELHKKGNIYVMDEPTTGLHMADIFNFSKIIKKLVKNNNTVIIIEHNTEIIRMADWIIDMGPEGGKNGGRVLFEGTPNELKNCKESYTAQFI